MIEAKLATWQPENSTQDPMEDLRKSGKVATIQMVADAVRFYLDDENFPDEGKKNPLTLYVIPDEGLKKILDQNGGIFKVEVRAI